MRKREFLSPTAISKYKESVETFYLDYLAENRPEREPQTMPMSIGSAFDAYVKNWLHERIFGKGFDPAYELDAIFEAQVEPHNRAWAKPNGEYVFQKYEASGALKDLLFDLSTAATAPRFEFTLQGVVKRNDLGVPLLGKPDLHYKNKHGISVVHDWKVNGFCAKSAVSPHQGYVKLRNCNGDMTTKAHKDAMLAVKDKIVYSSIHPLDKVNQDWATQLAIYAWLLGEEVGGEFFVSVHQIVCAPDNKLVNNGRPILRVAEHMSLITPTYQHQEYSLAHKIWDDMEKGHIFSDLSLEESQLKCSMLERHDAPSKIYLDPNVLG